MIFSLVADLQVYQQAYPHATIHQQSYMKTSIEPFDFSWEWKTDLHNDDITAMNLLWIYLHNELILLNTVGGFLWASGKAQLAYQLGPFPSPIAELESFAISRQGTSMCRFHGWSQSFTVPEVAGEL